MVDGVFHPQMGQRGRCGWILEEQVRGVGPLLGGPAYLHPDHSVDEEEHHDQQGHVGQGLQGSAWHCCKALGTQARSSPNPPEKHCTPISATSMAQKSWRLRGGLGNGP